MMPIEKVTLPEKFASFTEHWRPKIVGELNGQEVKVVKFKGEFVWHQHEDADEMFLVWRGRMRVEFRDRAVELAPGEFLIVPRGIEHRTAAEEETEVVLFEPAATRNTGNVSATMRLTAPGGVKMLGSDFHHDHRHRVMLGVAEGNPDGRGAALFAQFLRASFEDDEWFSAGFPVNIDIFPSHGPADPRAERL